MRINKITSISWLAVLGSLLVTTAITPVRAADMTFERALNVAQEPQNWVLHHGNYQGHRFSQLKEINTETVKNLKPVFSMALDGIEGAGTRNIYSIAGGMVAKSICTWPPSKSVSADAWPR